MNLYLIKSKVDLIKEAQEDFFNLYGKECKPFTRKIYFYFFIQDNKKYIHKKSLRFIYSNAETYTKEVDPYYCNLTKSLDPAPDVEPFLSSYDGELLPKLLEDNDKFFVYEYFEGDPVDAITADEFQHLKAQDSEVPFTPFYNSMTYNLARNAETIKLIDFKHFDPRQNLPFFVYLYNEDNRVNTLYIEKNTDTDAIVGHLGIDYPVKDAKIIEY
jgi:hypothetical protein